MVSPTAAPDSKTKRMPFFKKTQRSFRGFTLTELLIAIAIATIVFGLSFLVWGENTRAKTRDGRRIADVNSIKLTVEAFYEKNNKYPPLGAFYLPYKEEVFTSESGAPDWIPELVPTYAKELPKDPKQIALNIGNRLASFLNFFKKIDLDPIKAAHASTSSVVFDNRSRTPCDSSAASTQTTWQHTVQAGGINRFLMVEVTIRDATAYVQSITYAGQPLDLLDFATGTDIRTELWYSRNFEPATGTSDVVVNLSAFNKYAYCGALSWQGVNQSSPFGTHQTNSGSGTIATVSNIAVNDYQVVVDVLGRKTALGTATAGSGQTVRINEFLAVYPPLSSSQKEISGQTSTQMRWSWAGSYPWAMIAVPLNSAGFSSSPIKLTDTSPPGSYGGISTISHNQTIADCTDRYLLVSIGSSSSVTVTGVRLDNNTALNKLGGVYQTGNWLEMWGLKDPPIGSHTIDVTLSGFATAVVGATTWAGVNQTLLPSFVGNNGASATSANLTIPSAAGQVVVDTIYVGSSGPITPSTSQTRLWDLLGLPFFRVASSAKNGSSSVTMSWSWTSPSSWNMGAVAIRPAGGTPPTCPAPPSTASPSPSPVTGFYYLYQVTADRKKYNVWAILENKKDPRIYNHSEAQCKDTPPPQAEGYNFCGAGF